MKTLEIPKDVIPGYVEQSADCIHRIGGPRKSKALCTDGGNITANSLLRVMDVSTCHICDFEFLVFIGSDPLHELFLLEKACDDIQGEKEKHGVTNVLPNHEKTPIDPTVWALAVLSIFPTYTYKHMPDTEGAGECMPEHFIQIRSFYFAYVLLFARYLVGSIDIKYGEKVSEDDMARLVIVAELFALLQSFSQKSGPLGDVEMIRKRREIDKEIKSRKNNDANVIAWADDLKQKTEEPEQSSFFTNFELAEPFFEVFLFRLMNLDDEVFEKMRGIITSSLLFFQSLQEESKELQMAVIQTPSLLTEPNNSSSV
jgi:hypothetical protein